MKKKIFLLLLIVLLLIQFKTIDRSNPERNAEEDFIALAPPPQAIADMLKTSCYDCHSRETQYPWYSYVAPISWWLVDHIEHGRKHLDFSDWGNYSAKEQSHLLEECAEVLEEKEMPMLPYMIGHPSAWLSQSERNQLSAYFKGAQ